MSRYWCGVVSREHIKRGEKEGFCQVCHGKRGPLERMSEGDGIVFYSPVTQFKGSEKCQKFTAIGRVSGAQVYPFRMAPDFVPFRRDVEYFAANEAPIQPLLDELEFTRGKGNWGYKFRFGHFELSEHDFLLIARRMRPNGERMPVDDGATEAALPDQAQLFAGAAAADSRRDRATEGIG